MRACTSLLTQPKGWISRFKAKVFLVTFPALLLLVPQATHAQRINAAGNSSYKDSLGNVWVADQAYAPGSFGFINGTPY